MRIEYRCKQCGSTEVVVDAWAEWDNETQRFVLRQTFDYAYCLKCDGETKLVDVEIDDNGEEESGDNEYNLFGSGDGQAEKNGGR